MASGRYRKKAKVVTATQVKERLILNKEKNPPIIAEAGDWLVAGEELPIKDDIFNKEYELIVDNKHNLLSQNLYPFCPICGQWIKESEVDMTVVYTPSLIKEQERVAKEFWFHDNKSCFNSEINTSIFFKDKDSDMGIKLPPSEIIMFPYPPPKDWFND